MILISYGKRVKMKIYKIITSPESYIKQKIYKLLYDYFDNKEDINSFLNFIFENKTKESISFLHKKTNLTLKICSNICNLFLKNKKYILYIK